MVRKQTFDVNGALMKTDLPGTLFRSGKVRETYYGENYLTMVATDRISAFDVILPNGIPRKGDVLTQMTLFWLPRTVSMIGNHLLPGDTANLASGEFKEYYDHLKLRTVVVKKANVLPVECVVRGYIEGSGWKEYQAKGSVTGIKLPTSLKRGSKLPEPIFTPSTKAETGHDENITFDQMRAIIKDDAISKALRRISLELYVSAAQYAISRGIIIADTKFEFGLHGPTRELILLDEVLTPDSSRFWPFDKWEPGKAQPSFDKQYVRDYLETLDWNKTPPGPVLPADVVLKTTEKYLEAYERLTGKKLES